MIFVKSPISSPIVMPKRNSYNILFSVAHNSKVDKPTGLEKESTSIFQKSLSVKRMESENEL